MCIQQAALGKHIQLNKLISEANHVVLQKIIGKPMGA